MGGSRIGAAGLAQPDWQPDWDTHHRRSRIGTPTTAGAGLGGAGLGHPPPRGSRIGTPTTTRSRIGTPTPKWAPDCGRRIGTPTTTGAGLEEPDWGARLGHPRPPRNAGSSSLRVFRGSTECGCMVTSLRSGSRSVVRNAGVCRRHEGPARPSHGTQAAARTQRGRVWAGTRCRQDVTRSSHDFGSPIPIGGARPFGTGAGASWRMPPVHST